MFLDIVLLRTFVAVVEANGFTRAAGFVNLTQSAVSLHIKRLEEQIGRRLFDRAASKLALTPDGEILLSYAQRILALEEEVKTRLGHPEPEGVVRFGAPEYFDPGTLASLLAQFKSRYPAIDLEIQMGIGTDIAALYGRGLLDVAIINREIDEADGAGHEDTTVLYREGRVWAALPDMRLDNDRPVPLALFPAPCALCAKIDIASPASTAVTMPESPVDCSATVHRRPALCSRSCANCRQAQGAGNSANGTGRSLSSLMSGSAAQTRPSLYSTVVSSRPAPSASSISRFMIATSSRPRPYKAAMSVPMPIWISRSIAG